MKIAVLLTCFNRKSKTLSCLTGLSDSLLSYNVNANNFIEIEIFLTDDGCTDGTAEAVKSTFPQLKIHILKGDGNLYWAGGMRFCWREAMKRHREWNYYLLLNDDVELFKGVFDELFLAQQYALDNFGKEGIVSGITCASYNENEMTYGGDVWVNKILATRKRLYPNGMPQLCDLTNANILLVPTEVVDNVGIFYEGYQHALADFDYSVMVRRAGFPVVLTANFCGKCDKDHLDENARAVKVMSMSLNERKVYFNNPIHSNRDYLRFIRRTSPIRMPIVWIGRMMNLYFPKFYYNLSNKRKRV